MGSRQQPSTEEGSESELLGAEGSNTLLGRLGGGGSGGPSASDEAPERTGAALRHLAVVAAVLGAAMLVPYASAELRRWQPWVRGEGVPIARMFLREEPAEGGMAVATGGAVRRSGASSQAELSEQLGEGVAANLEEPPSSGPPHPGAQGEGAQGEGGQGEGGQGEGGQGEGDDGPRVRIAPSELEGLVREIEDPSGRVMRPFYESLLQTAERERGAITRVAHYGDSSIAGDGITSTVRRRLQQRFGDAGHGFVLIARGTMPYRHVDVHHEASGSWRLVQLVRSGLSSGHYGYGGVQFRAAHGATAQFGASERGPVGGSVSRFELWYQEHPRGGRLDLRVDRGERVELQTRGSERRDAWHVVDVPDGEHRLELRAIGGGDSHLYGMVLERDGPGVVYDSLGMVGARARRMLNYDAQHFARQHARRGTNLIVIGFGGNDADDARTPEEFEQDFRRVARMVRRARPEAACLLMAPLDQAHRDERGAVRTMEQVPVIVAAQRRAARAEGCAFFDTFEAMGGEGAMRSWLRATPRLAFGDLRHATPAGYRVIGNMLYKALLKGFADFLEERR